MQSMAEAAVEEPVIPRLFFCHKCSLEITRLLPDYTCPSCRSGFIEELDTHTAPDTTSSDQHIDVEDITGIDILNQRLGEELTEILMGYGGPRRGGRGRGREASESRRASRYGGILPRERILGNRPGRDAGAARQMAPIETLIQDFIENVTGAGGVAWHHGIGLGRGRNNGPVYFLGNPGDYAWGREGLDAIVTQLLNQMDGAGPPPLAKDKIKEIPVVVISDEQVDKSLQCSVCWEDFRLEEPVRKLPCEHVYHENCIIPWLELHGTCPVCRQSLSEDGTGMDESQANFGYDPVNVGRTSLAALFRGANTASTGSQNSSTSSSMSSSNGSTASGANTSSSGSSQPSRPSPDFNMDLEFD